MIADRNNSACVEPSRCRAGASLALLLLARVFDLLPAAPRHLSARTAAVTGGHSAARRAAPVAHAAGGSAVGRRTVTIRAMGGSRPLIFLVDGAPLPAERVSGPRLFKEV